MWEIILIALVALLIFGGMNLPRLFKSVTKEMDLTTPHPDDTCVLCEKKIDELLPEYDKFKNKYENGINRHFGGSNMKGYKFFKEIKVYQGTAIEGEKIYPICNICGLCIEKLYGKWWFNSKRIGWASEATKQLMKVKIDLKPGKKLLDDLDSDLSGLREKIADYRPQFESILEEETKNYNNENQNDA